MQIIFGNIKHTSYSFVGAILRFLENAFLASSSTWVLPIERMRYWTAKEERMD